MKQNSSTPSDSYSASGRTTPPSRFFRPSMAREVAFNPRRPAFLDTFNGSFWQPLRLDLLQSPLTRHRE
jgi:hypothetical protein